MKFAALVTAGALSITVTALQAQTNVSPNLSAGVGSFYTDRYNPASFAVNGGVVQGRNNVLQILIDQTTDAANRPSGLQATFYNTQGRKTNVNTSGSWLFQSDLFVSSSWATPSSGYVRTDMWATATSDAGFAVPSKYPIIGFTNYGGAARFRGFDINTGSWNDFLNNTVLLDAWNTLEMSFDASTKVLTYSVNGLFAGSVTDAVSTGVANVMYQAYNFNDPLIDPDMGNPAYTANWSNTAVVPEPSTYALMAVGLSVLAAASRRRRRRAVAA